LNSERQLEATMMMGQMIYQGFRAVSEGFERLEHNLLRNMLLEWIYTNEQERRAYIESERQRILPSGEERLLLEWREEEEKDLVARRDNFAEAGFIDDNIWSFQDDLPYSIAELMAILGNLRNSDWSNLEQISFFNGIVVRINNGQARCGLITRSPRFDTPQDLINFYQMTRYTLFYPTPEAQPEILQAIANSEAPQFYKVMLYTYFRIWKFQGNPATILNEFSDRLLQMLTLHPNLSITSQMIDDLLANIYNVMVARRQEAEASPIVHQPQDVSAEDITDGPSQGRPWG
jgi:hypothetical protein